MIMTYVIINDVTIALIRTSICKYHVLGAWKW